MQITRRSALKGGTAVACVAAAGKVAGAAAARTTSNRIDPDGDLLSRISATRNFYMRHQEAHARWIAEKRRVEALAECPPFVVPAHDRAGYDRYNQFMAEHGIDDLCKRSNNLHEEAGRNVEAVFQTPARTLTGALEKLRLVYSAIGDGPGTNTGDEDLNVFQDLEKPWMAQIIRDLERLAGRVQS